MDYRVESEVWKTAQQAMSTGDFCQIVLSAVVSYKRLPGHSMLERLHAGHIGIGAVQALRKALDLCDLLLPGDAPDFVSLRAALRSHLCAVLQWQLISTSHASGAVVDDHFAGDLGL